MKYFQLTPDKAAEQLHTDLTCGLSVQQAEERAKEYGKNELPNRKHIGFGKCFLHQFSDYMIVILLIAAVIVAVISFLQKDMTGLVSAAAIVLIVLFNCMLGAIRENHADKIFSFLDKASSSRVKVFRGGKEYTIPSEQLVPGDLIVLEAGNFVPADGRIVSEHSLKIDETALSGENLPSEKSVSPIEGDNHPIAELCNMVFAGTTVVSGSASVLVTAIGNETLIAKSTVKMQSSGQAKTPLQMQMHQMSKALGLCALAVCVVVFILALIEGKPLTDTFLISVALAVAAVPEGLATMVTVILARGVSQLAGEKTVIRNLTAIESVGSATVICTNKTGTLTQNRMTVVSCYTGDGVFPFVTQNYKKAAELILYGSMCNDAFIQQNNGEQVRVGDPTECALIAALESLGKDKLFLDSQYPKMGKIPFDSDRKRKSSIHIIGEHNVVIVKGAPESIFAECVNADSKIEKYRKAMEEMESRTLRVLAIAVKSIAVIPSELMISEIETELHLIGLIGIMDPPQSETAAALRSCRSAGIRPIMITGDHVITARATAEQIGIFGADDITLTGSELDQMTDEEFEECFEKCSVYARVLPEHRTKIISAWQRHGHIVAATGEGVDDVPGLQQADVGFAMGQSCTDIAKNVSDIFLLHDDFAGLMSTVRRCRGIYNNVLKSVQYILAGNVAEILLVLTAMVLLFGIPLLPLPLLWLNLFVASFPALALGTETARSKLMERRPRDKKDALISKRTTFRIVWQGILIAAVSLLGFVIGTRNMPRTEVPELLTKGQTMAFAVLAFSQIFHAFDCKSRHLAISTGLFNNKWLNLSALVSAGLVLIVMLVPGIHTVFGICALGIGEWLTVLGLSIIPFFICEFVKLFKRG